MIEKLIHSLAAGWEELRLIAPYAAAALVTGGSISSALLALVWLFQRHHRTEAARS